MIRALVVPSFFEIAVRSKVPQTRPRIFLAVWLNSFISLLLQQHLLYKQPTFHLDSVQRSRGGSGGTSQGDVGGGGTSLGGGTSQGDVGGGGTSLGGGTSQSNVGSGGISQGDVGGGGTSLGGDTSQSDVGSGGISQSDVGGGGISLGGGTGSCLVYVHGALLGLILREHA